MTKQAITVQTLVQAPVEKVWVCFNEPSHIKQWAFASDDWEAPASKNDLLVGGSFTTTMAAKDGSAKFDFSGVYSAVEKHKLLAYAMSDGRQVRVQFQATDEGTKVTETFDPEHENSLEMQKAGWQAILNNFKKHVEACK